MYALLKLYFNVCRLKAGPQDMPASPALLGVTMVAYLVTGLLLAITEMPLLASLGQVVLDLLILCAVVWFALSMHQWSNRWQQTVTAITGSGSLLNIIGVPLVQWISRADEAGGDVQTPSLFLLVLLIWSLVVFVHIVRQAIESNAAVAVALGLAYFMLSILLGGLLFPAG